MSQKIHFGDTGLGIAIGVAIVILSLCFGIGGCNHLSTAPDPTLTADHNFFTR